jgi:hypothetical protein
MASNEHKTPATGLSPAENILYRSIAEVFNSPHETHKELTNKRASVMLSEKIEGHLQVVADTGLLKWAFIPCFQQMFHDTNALPLNLHSNFQMVLDFLAYAHEGKIQVRGGGDDLTAIAVLRGGEAVPYRGTKRARTLRYALREALEWERYNVGQANGPEVIRTLEKYHYLFQTEGDAKPPGGEAGAVIDRILTSFQDWIPVIETYQDHHVVVDCFLRALQDEGLDIVEGQA